MRLPPDRTVGPLIVDTDIGSDPDDAVALAAATVAAPDLALVLSTDETSGGIRARFARALLDALGRPDVPVVAGARLPGTPPTTVDGLIPLDGPDPAGDLVAAVSALADRAGGPVRWLGLGPLTNLATVLTLRPDLAPRLRLTQMGGALRYRDPTRAEHNFRRDPAAVAAVLAAVDAPALVMSDHTFTTAVEITHRSDVYRGWADPGAPSWAELLRTHHDNWFARFHPGSMQHDALALSVAVGMPFVDLARHRCRVDAAGRLGLDPAGRRALLSCGADHAAFMRWLAGLLDGRRHRTTMP